MVIAQISDVHVGGSRFRPDLLHVAIDEINEARPDLVVVAGDITDDGYGDQYPEAQVALARLECSKVVLVPGNHDARNVGDLRFEDTFGSRDSRHRMQVGGLEVAIVAVDSSKPDLDEGQIGREHYSWIAEGFAGAADLRVFICHHHLVAIPGTGRDRNQLMDAGDVLALLRDCRNDIVLSGHRHVPYLWAIAGMYLIHSGTVSTTRTRGFPEAAYNLIHVADEQIEVELRVPGGVRHSLGRYPRNWPEALSARYADPFTRFSRGGPLAPPGPPGGL
jgi:3',5'-cyclic AMP phosphodiesterase CpdA